MEIPKQGYDDDDVTEEEEKENVGTLASPPWRNLDTEHGIRMDGEHLMIGDSAVCIDQDDNVTINWPCLEGRRSVRTLHV